MFTEIEKAQFMNDLIAYDNLVHENNGIDDETADFLEDLVRKYTFEDIEELVKPFQGRHRLTDAADDVYLRSLDVEIRNLEIEQLLDIEENNGLYEVYGKRIVALIHLREMFYN